MEWGLRIESVFRLVALIPHDSAFCNEIDKIDLFWWSMISRNKDILFCKCVSHCLTVTAHLLRRLDGSHLEELMSKPRLLHFKKLFN